MPTTLEKKPRRPLIAWALPLFFVLVGAWYVAAWAASPPLTLTFRFMAGVILLLYGGWRLLSLRRPPRSF